MRKLLASFEQIIQQAFPVKHHRDDPKIRVWAVVMMS